MTLLIGALIGAAGSILAAIIIALFFRSRAFILLLGSSAQLAIHLRRERIVALQLTREQYRERLPQFLSHAQHSIAIVSISLRVPDDEAGLSALFRQRIEGNPTFRINVSLLGPKSAAVQQAAASLNVPPEELKEESRTMLRRLIRLRSSLQEVDRPRLQVLVHDSFPMGSAILLDATPEVGRIQVETKLYRAPRIESFGYEVIGPSPFYSRNYRAWMRVFDESMPVREEDLQ